MKIKNVSQRKHDQGKYARTIVTIWLGDKPLRNWKQLSSALEKKQQ